MNKEENIQYFQCSNIGQTMGDVTLKQLINSTQVQIGEVKRFATRQFELKLAEIIDEVKHEDSEYSADDLLKSAIGDLSFLQVNFGSLRNAPDEALRMVYRMVSDIYNRTHHQTLDRGKTLLRLQIEMEKSGIKDASVVHETYEGKKTGYMISKVNYGAYEIEKQRAKAILAKEFGFESVQDMNYNDLSVKNQKLYSKRYKELFRDKYERRIGDEWLPNPPLNPEFDKLMTNKAFEVYYLEMKAMMRDSRNMLPSKYGNTRSYQFMLPQIRKDIMQTIKDKEGPLFAEIGNRMKESLLTNEEDTEFGTSSLDNSGVMRDVNGNIAKLIPIHYVTKIKNTDQLSNDITSMVTKFYEMASNFSNMSKNVDNLTIIQRAMAGRTFSEGSGGKAGLGVDSNAYKALDQFMDSFVYGKIKDKSEWKIPGTNTKLNTSKLTDKITAFVRGNNLFMNITTTISGYIKSNIDLFIDKQINNYTSNESGWWAEKEFDLNLIDIVNNLGKREKYGKPSLMFEYNGIFNDINETFNRFRMYSEYQDTGNITLVNNTNIKRRMRTWHYTVPRDNTGTLARLRNPWIHMVLEYDNNSNKRMVLHDVMYNFTPSKY